MKKRVLSLLLTLTMLLSLVPAMGITASAGTGVSYIDADGEEQICTDYEVVTADTTVFANDKWYVVNSNVTRGSSILSGTANLILCDGCTLTVTVTSDPMGAIEVDYGATLTIYGQSKGTGTLMASGAEDGGAGIGGATSGDCGDVIINGGTVIATGVSGAGIGGGLSAAGGSVTVNGGTVTATSSNGAGIGGGEYSSTHGTLTVASGATIKAGDSEGGAVEKTADQALGQKYVYIKVPTPVSYQDYNASTGKFETKTCTDYTVVTKDTTFADGGWYVVNSDVTRDGQITCTGAVHLILADGYTLTASAGIYVNENSSLTIYGQTAGTGTLTATGITNSTAGIGGGDDNSGQTCNGGDVTINGGTVTATGGANAAGIGGSKQGNGGKVTVNGGTVTATGGKSAAGIGGGTDGTSGKVFVDTSLVVKAGEAANSTDEIMNEGSDLASSLANKKFVSIEKPWYTSGNGEAATPYIISDYDGLEGFAAYVNGGNNMSGKYVKLADNFPNGGTAEALTTPIGNSSNKFNGTFDGNGKSVTLNVSGQYAGLFGYVNDDTAKVKNVNTTGTVTATGETTFAGGVVGKIKNGSVTNCNTTANVSGTYAGGVVGENMVGSVANCHATGSVSGVEAGGIVGYNEANGSVTNCYATGSVSGSKKAGGVVGNHSNGTVTNCYATGDVTGIGESLVGGVVGKNGGTVTNCYATGEITGIGESLVGGVVGKNSSTVKNCYSTTQSFDAAGSSTSITDANMKAAETSEDSLVYKLNNYLTTTSTPGAKLWKVESGVNGGYPTFTDVNYLDASGATKTCTDYTVVTSSDAAVTWTSGWYVVNSEVTISNASGDCVTASGDVKLILCDGATLTMTAQAQDCAGIFSLYNYENLTIYGQSNGTGKLISTGKGYGMRIGGTFTVNGGVVEASCNGYGMGIWAPGITINGGSVKASGGSEYNMSTPGISANGNVITVNGGTVTSIGGSGDWNSNVKFKIASGYVYKQADSEAALATATATPGTGAEVTTNQRVVLIKKAAPVASIDFGGETGEKEYATVQEAITAAVDGVTMAANARTVKLISDAKENITIDSGKYVILDLNDHVLKGDGTQSVIINEGTLTVTDSATSKTTRYFTDSDSDGCFETIYTDSGVPTGTEGTNYVKVTGGCITGGINDKKIGGGIYNCGTLTLNGGNIVGNKAWNGGGIYNWREKSFTMNGGCIIGNRATREGGGFFNDQGTVVLTKGTISYNSAYDTKNGSDHSGGGGIASSYKEADDPKISESDVKMTIAEDVTISNNYAYYGGGGIYSCYGTITVNGAKIQNNRSDVNGGGVRMYAGTHSPEFTMKSGEITGNKAQFYAGFGMNGGTANLLGGEISGNTFNNTDGNYGDAYCGAGAILINGTMNLGGSIKIYDNTYGESKKQDNLYICSGKTVTVSSTTALTGAAKVGVTLETAPMADAPVAITTNGTSADVSKFTSDSLAYKVKFIEASGEGESAVAAHLEFSKYTLTKLTTITNGITLEKSDMTEEQAVAVVEAANVDHSAYVIFGEAGQSTKYLFLMYSTDETKWMSATPNGNTLSELKQNVLENLYVIGEITEKDPDYLTLTAEEANSTVSFKWNSGSDVMYKASSEDVQVGGSAAKTTWTTYSAGTAITLTNVDDSVQFKGKNVVTNQYYHFTMSGKIAASGSVTSLTDGNGGDAEVTLTKGCYLAMFYGCTALTAAPKLPATKLAVNCYNSMFSGCTALETAPELPATELTENCYNYMFNGCTALKTAPQLPATTLAKACYLGLFKGCILLTAAPELKATALMESCYESMFDGCKALKTAPELPATELIKNCYYYMFSGCTALETAPELKATELADYCYNSMFKGCSKLTVVAVAAETDATWSIPYSSANYPVSNMATNTAVGSVTVETAKNSGEYNYYKVNSKEILTVTATADNMTYTGNAYDNSNVTVSAAKSGGDAVTGLTYTYTWYAANNSTTPLAGAPTDIGAYKLVVSIADSDETYTGKSEAIAINILPAPVDDAHKVVGGTSTYKIGSGEEIKFISIADNADFVKVTVSKDGGEAEQLTENEHYTRTSGSIKIALTETYIATLTPGKYVFMVHSKLPYATTETVVSAEFVVNVSRSTEFTASTYTVTVANAANGTVVSSAKAAASGSTVTLTVTPDKGYTLETLTVKDAKGNEIELTAKKLGETYTFKMPSSKVTVTATFMEDNTMLNFFVDVKASDYFYDAVLWAATNGITSGVDNLHFAPNAITTRGQMVTFLWRAAGSPEPTATSSSFTDVVAGSYYYKAVLWAVEKGITKGVSETSFAPNATVTRGQCVTFLYRYEGSPAVSVSNSFTDVKATDYYNNAVAWAATNKITTGATATTFAPNADCTRGQIVTFLYRDIVK